MKLSNHLFQSTGVVIYLSSLVIYTDMSANVLTPKIHDDTKIKGKVGAPK